MTDDEFAAFCAQHPDLSFETTSQHELIFKPPNFSLGGARNSQITSQLQVWALRDGRGVACDSSAGYVLPNGSRRSPDASWVLKHRVQQLTPESFTRYWHLCPDFVIELRSPTDRLGALREKMREWLANGAQLGWLIDPDVQTVEIFRPRAGSETLPNLSQISGEGVVDGFVLNLIPVWNPLGV